jgi:hypothetical protein
LSGIIQGDKADIVCNECGKVVQSVPAPELGQALDEIQEMHPVSTKPDEAIEYHSRVVQFHGGGVSVPDSCSPGVNARFPKLTCHLFIWDVA